MAWITCTTARVMNRRRVGLHSGVILTQDYPGADRGNTIVPSGTSFWVEDIRKDVGGDGSRVMLYGKWGDKRISVPAFFCKKISGS
jgi:hypothetical protein